jgi:phytoene dehydrogenase-like protein
MSDVDVVVVGGGISGVMAGLRLQSSGLRTVLVEQNHQLGGLAAGIVRHGFRFDVGCQSVIDAGILFPLLERAGVHDGRWRQARFRVVSDDGGYDFVAAGLAQVADALAAGDPGAAGAIHGAFARHRRAARAIDTLRRHALPHVHEDDSSRLSQVRTLGRMAWPMLACRASLRERYESFYRKRLPAGPAQRLLTALGYPGMSAFFAGAVWDCWSRDYWYPDGGLQQWFDDLGRHYVARGGAIRLKSRVETVRCTGGRCTGVALGSGEVLDARAVVSSTDLGQLYGSLLPDDHLHDRDRRFVTRVRSTPLTTPLLAGYIGLSWTPAELRQRVGAAHFFHVPLGSASRPGPDADGHRQCWIQIAAHAAFDPTATRASVVVQCFTDPAWQNRFGVGDGAALPRPRAYQELTVRLRDDLVHLLDRAIPGAQAATEYAEVGTPLSTERFTRSPLGSSAGFSWYWPDVPRRTLGVRRGIRGLYTCGQTTIWPGSVALSAWSGKVAADRVVGDLRA